MLLGFDEPLGEVLYLESSRTRHENLLISEGETIFNRGFPVIEDAAEEIAGYEDRFEKLDRLALEPSESIRLLDQIADEMG